MSELSIPPIGWTAVGRTTNTRYFHTEPDILFVVPDDGLRDDGESAGANAEFQIEFARNLGRRVALVVRMTSLRSQDAAARRVYAERMELEHFYAAALVAANPISRAIASFFLGLTKPRFPTRVHDSYDSAIEWIGTVRRNLDS